MNLMCKSAWMALMLGALIGCAGEEEAAPPSTPPPGMGPGPSATRGEPAKATPSKEMTPPPAKDDMKSDEKATKPEETKKGDSPTLEGPKPGGTTGASPAKFTDEEMAAIKQLPAEEQAAAIKQVSCPVSNEHLGEMGKPVKVTAEGRTFYLCCEGCEKDVKADPKAVIAKLDKAAKK